MALCPIGHREPFLEAISGLTKATLSEGAEEPKNAHKGFLRVEYNNY